MNRKSASPFWSLIQIVLGGLAAVPIALLLLWWVLGKDVAGAGPIVGEYLPWIVPEAFRPIDESSAVARRRQLLIPPASGLPQLSDASIDQDVAAADPLEPPVSPSLLAQISDCRRALDEWRVVAQSGEGDLKPIARSIYGSLTEMATMVNDLSTETSVAPSVCSALQPVALDIKQNPDLQSVVRQGAVYWLEKNSAAGEFPLAAVLELGEVVELPESWMVTAPTTKAWPPSIEAILIPQSLAPSPTPGQKLFLLGKVTKRTDVATEQAPNVRSLVAAYLYDL